MASPLNQLASFFISGDRTMFACAALLGLLASGLAGSEIESARAVLPLERGWEFRTEVEAEDAWRPASVPSSLEEFAGTDFDGVGLYRLRIDRPSIPPGSRALLRFDAAATEATVFVDGNEVGTHLGGWSPFRFDITTRVTASAPEVPLELLVRLDEKVGHNTQGFLPIVAPHFGGLWQAVSIEFVPAVHVDDVRLLAVGNRETGRIKLEVPLIGADQARIALAYRRLGEEVWSEGTTVEAEGGTLRAELAIPEARPWSPDDPALYEVRLRVEGEPGDTFITRAAFRSIAASDDQLRLNGQPLSVRGLLNWGYYPPNLAPIPDEERFRADLQFARDRGFNLMKFCLWVPPKRYLELCDELGMLAWVEYPTWHPKLDQAHRDDLLREYAEFFTFDRNHPSVILRSLTCETGPSADLEVIRSLYDQAYAMIPGAVVEDDSSWIGWNRIHDFYDDHPYGNNHTWVATLERLKAHIAEREAKPLVLGEAIAADTWVDRDSMLELYGGQRPYWFPGFFDANAAWIEAMFTRYGPGGLDRLVRDSKHYAMLMRKYQIEAYRREVPAGGYVVSVIRDFPLAGMGLIDYMDRPKWPAEDWAWQGDTMLLLRTPDDRRAFAAREIGSVPIALDVSHFGPEPLQGATVSLSGGGANQAFEHAITGHAQEPGTLRREVIRFDRLGAGENLVHPEPRQLRASLRGPNQVENVWPYWIVPDARLRPVRLHPSVDEATAALFPDSATLDDTSGVPVEVIVARRFDARLLELLERGARVLMLPDGEKGSFALANHWFLRGAPYMPDHPVFSRVPRDFMVELQHFDLAGPVVPRIEAQLDHLDPILLLWDNHDLKEVGTHGLVFASKVGKGRLLVSALNHGPVGNAAGAWMLDVLLDHLETGPPPRRGWDAGDLARLKDRIDERAIDLGSRAWRFRPDPENRGLEQNWHMPDHEPTEGWTDLRIDRHWESQGFDTLDGWAWYRTTVEIPEDWQGRELFISFRGVDDHYEVYVNGQLAGSGGDIAMKQTAFEERVSHRITDLAEPGRACVVAVRVYDWYGAGGIFRPVSVGTARIGPESDWIR